jgi:hypothetical protein
MDFRLKEGNTMELKKEIILKDKRDSKTINALTNAIIDAEGRATARTISYDEIFYILERIKKRLNITKKAMEGIKVFCDPNAQEFSKAYRYTPESTQFNATFKNGKWRITAIYRSTCGKDDARIELTEDAKNAIIANYEIMRYL